MPYVTYSLPVVQNNIQPIIDSIKNLSDFSSEKSLENFEIEIKEGSTEIQENNFETPEKFNTEKESKEETLTPIEKIQEPIIKEEDKNSGCTVILANPPFGSKEKKETILNKYILGSKNSIRNSQKTEILFLEKGIKLLKPEGKMLIVIPSGILSNESYKYVRDYLHSEAEIRAVIDLPTHTFVQSGVPTIKTSILYLQKFTTEKKRKYDETFKDKSTVSNELKENIEYDYQVFMGNAEYIGFEPNGRMINNGEATDLDLLLEDFKKQSELVNKPVDLVEFSSKYYQDKESTRIDNANIRGTNKDLKNSFVINFSDLEDRLDTSYYFFKNNSFKLLKKFEPLGYKLINKK